MTKFLGFVYQKLMLAMWKKMQLFPFTTVSHPGGECPSVLGKISAMLIIIS